MPTILAAALLLLGETAAPHPNPMTIKGLDAGRLALAEVCLPAIAESRPVADLAKARGMIAMPPSAAGAGKDDKAWRLGMAQPAYAIAWADGSCTASVEKGDPAALRDMAQAAILARPEGFRLRSSMTVEGGRLERTVYCAHAGDRWILASLTLPGPAADRRTRALSSTIYARTTPSALCDGG